MNEKRFLYLECYSGLSGDMAVASLLDLGADQDSLMKTLDSLPIGDFEIKISRVQKSGLSACDFDVQTPDNHDHDMEYVYGKKEISKHGEHRHYHEIREILKKADMTSSARETAEDIFHVLAVAESKVHGIPIENVSFHEVGAVDSIVDIISAAVCLDSLDVEEVIVSELYDGKGFVRCQHGLIPVPVPAVVAIAAEYSLKMHLLNIDGEYVTPTGAAIAASIRTREKLPECFKIKRIGLGAGKRITPLTGVVRAMIITEDTLTDTRNIVHTES